MVLLSYSKGLGRAISEITSSLVARLKGTLKSTRVFAHTIECEVLPELDDVKVVMELLKLLLKVLEAQCSPTKVAEEYSLQLVVR